MSSILGIGGNIPSATADFYDYNIENSVRFDGSSSVLTKTWGSAGTSDKKFAISVWVKGHKMDGTWEIVASSAQSYLMCLAVGARYDSDAHAIMYYMDNGNDDAGSVAYARDPSAWRHVVMILDSTQSGSDKLKIYNNGDLWTAGDSTYWNIDYGDGLPPDNMDSSWGMNGYANEIGRYQYNSTAYYSGYMAEFICIDGTASISDFGETKDGVWIPKDPSGLTFGNNGFWLKFTNSSDFGEDFSGNNNDWSTSGFATSDQMSDSPTYSSSDGNGGNFCTVNPLKKDTNLSALDEGNLKFDCGTNQRGAICTFEIPLSGKWYFEMYVKVGSAMQVLAGINGIDVDLTSSRGGQGDSNCYAIDYVQYVGSEYQARKRIAGVGSAGSGDIGTTDNAILGVAVNRDDNEIKVYYNNILLFTNAISATVQYFPWIGVGGASDASTFGVFNFGQDGTFAGNKTAGGNADENGYGKFFYSPLSGHLALSAGNLSGDDPTDTTDAPITTSTTFTGNGNADGAIVFLGGVPTAGTINGNTIRFGTDADKLANGLKLRTSSSSYNTSGSNTLEITSTGSIFRFANAQNNL